MSSYYEQGLSTRDFEILIEAHYEDLYRFAFSLARNPDDACDLTQQAFAIYAEKGDQIRETLKRKNWLFTTLYREFLKTRSRGQRQVSMEETDLESHQAVTESGAQRETEQHELLDSLAALAEDQRAILTLFYLDQHSYKDIAVILGIPTGTVMSRLSRAKESLRGSYENGRKAEGINPRSKALMGYEHLVISHHRPSGLSKVRPHRRLRSTRLASADLIGLGFAIRSDRLGKMAGHSQSRGIFYRNRNPVSRAECLHGRQRGVVRRALSRNGFTFAAHGPAFDCFDDCRLRHHRAGSASGIVG